jgi:hypothetical protein
MIPEALAAFDQMGSADADSIPVAHAAEFFALFGGGLRRPPGQAI